MCACGRPKQAKSEQCATCRTVAKDSNGNWKGGRTIHKAGYVMVRVPDHPRAKKSPYVFEHILVAERILGRYLEPGESVHHRNGVRDDNRPENLELWIRPQPSGIRVSDAIAWAVEILERYVGEGSWRTSNNALANANLEVAGVEATELRAPMFALKLRAVPAMCPRVTSAERLIYWSAESSREGTRWSSCRRAR